MTTPSVDHSQDYSRDVAIARVAAKARLLERLLAGDERVLATELRSELEQLCGPSADVVPLDAHRRVK